MNIPYFAWDDLEPPPQTSVGFRTTLWEPQRGAACLPACLPRRSHRPRKYLGTSANRRLNLFCLPPPPFFLLPFLLPLLLLPLPLLLLVLFPHTHTQPVVSVEWEGNNSSPCPSPLLQRAPLPPSAPSSQCNIPVFKRDDSRGERVSGSHRCVAADRAAAPGDTRARARTHTHLEITM